MKMKEKMLKLVFNKIIKASVVVTLVLSLLAIVSFDIKASDPYEIKNFEVNIFVREDGVYEITENITVYFNEQRQGIYRDLYEYHNFSWLGENSQEKNIEYFFPISNINTFDETLEISDYSNGKRLRLGDEGRYLTGEHTYKISYQVHTTKLDLVNDPKEQLFYYDVIDYNWDASIANVDINVEFEKAVDFSSLEIYYGDKQISNNFIVTDNSIQISSGQLLDYYQGVSVYLELYDYYIYADYTNLLYFALISSVVLLLIIIVLFKYFGRDEKRPVVVEFSPPENLDSAGVGYLINAQVNQRDVMSLIIEWAKDGYLNISDENEFTLIKMKDLPDSKPLYQQDMFSALFKEKDKVNTLDLQEQNFAADLALMPNRIVSYYREKEHKIYQSKSTFIKWLMALSLMIPFVLLLLGLSANESGSLVFFMPFSSIMIAILTLGSFLLFVLINQVFQNKYVIKSFKLSMVAYFILNIILFIFIVLLISKDYLIISFSVLVLNSVSQLILCFMHKYTSLGLKQYYHVLGLYQFIKTAEKDRLEMLVKDNPKIFYDILPYAYTFNLAEVWEEHFREINIPKAEFYQSSSTITDFMLWNMVLRNQFNNFSTNVTPVNIKGFGDSSGGFGGGGFGSGGFGGGGFGGGGGGSW
ncbi:MAG: DUF2207 family protein [Erysipelotrichaceae bacterium]